MKSYTIEFANKEQFEETIALLKRSQTIKAICALEAYVEHPSWEDHLDLAEKAIERIKELNHVKVK